MAGESGAEFKACMRASSSAVSWNLATAPTTDSLARRRAPKTATCSAHASLELAQDMLLAAGHACLSNKAPLIAMHL